MPRLRLPNAPIMSGVSPVTVASQLGTEFVGSCARMLSSTASRDQPTIVLRNETKSTYLVGTGGMGGVSGERAGGGRW